TDPDLQAAHAAFPWVTTWDDHETENNYAGAISEDGDPEEVFLAQRAAAYQAYYEHLPLRPSSMPQGPDLRLYRRLAYGNLAELSMLDTRQYRSDQPCGDGLRARCAAAQDLERTMTGPEQERWLLRGLDESGARWKVIAQQVMLAELMIPRSGERQFNLDQWDGYPAARNRILGHVMSRAIPNTMVLTGDIHSAWISDLKADFEEPASATVATEFVTSSITADNPFANQLRLLVPVNDHIRYYDGRHGYGRCEVTPERWQTDVRAMENVTEPDAAIETVASFVVEAGQPGAQRG
ncbi:MAG: alkaline phosphatase D family protein, partial [Chloroflexota bacterium]|nr:alkaline phosphatase D family protein [Chloroflexota bacterium]